MSTKIPDDQIKDWQDYLSYGADDMNNPQKELESKEGVLTLDLHHKTLAESEKLIDSAFKIASKQNLKTIEIVTGIGKNKNSEFGTLYKEVPRLLEFGKFKHQYRSFKRSEDNDGVLLVRV